MSSKKYKLKWDTTIHLLQCPKSRRLTAPKAGEIVELKELLFFAGGNAKSYCLFRSQFDSFILKLNILLTILYSSLAPLNQPRCPSVSRWVICGIYPDSGILFSCTSGKEPACQCRRHKTRGFDPWVRKITWRKAWWLTPVFCLEVTVHGVAKSWARLKWLSTYKRKWAIKPWRYTEEVWVFLVKEEDLKRLHIVWFQPYDSQAEKSCRDSKKIGGCLVLGWWREGMLRWSCEITLYGAIMVYIVETQRMYNITSESCCKVWTLVDSDVCQYRFFGCNKCPTLVGDVDNGKAIHVVGGRQYIRNLFTFHSVLLWL